MTLLLLIDGYNLAQPIAPVRRPDPRWLQRSRESLLRDLCKHLPETVREQTCVVFDAADPPRNRPSTFAHDGIEVRFAVGYPSADDLLEEIIQAHPTPKRLAVISSDHRIQIAARRRRAVWFDSEPWMDDLTDDRIRLAIKWPRGHGRNAPERRAGSDAVGSESVGTETGGAGQGGQAAPDARPGDATRPSKGQKPRIEDPDEVQQWMREFGFDED